MGLYLSLSPWKGLWRLAGSSSRSAAAPPLPPLSRRWDWQTQWRAAPELNAGLNKDETGELNLKCASWMKCQKTSRLRWTQVVTHATNLTHSSFNNLFADHVSIKRATHSIQWAGRRPAKPGLDQAGPKGALEGGGCEIPNGHVCSSFQRLFLLSSARCPNSSASKSQHSRCYDTKNHLGKL